jgi:hypothetical protein
MPASVAAPTAAKTLIEIAATVRIGCSAERGELSMASFSFPASNNAQATEREGPLP